MSVEHVLVIPSSLLDYYMRPQGFFGDVFTSDPKAILASFAFHWAFQPRPEMETNPDYKQLIPYVIFQYDEPGGETKLFSYVRGTDQGEARLHAKRSVGVGGHINPDDERKTVFSDPYLEGLHRELEEEVIVVTRHIGSNVPVGFINDDSNDVGKVHLGVVHVVRVNNPKVYPREKSMIDARFIPVSELFRDIDSLETWSQIVLRALYTDSVEPLRGQRQDGVIFDDASVPEDMPLRPNEVFDKLNEVDREGF